jgi:UDP-glucose 4-epimerase
MHILLTGASGRIGSYLVQALQNEGHTVRGFDIAEPRAYPPPETMVIGSLVDENAVNRAVDGVDAVLHLAALMSWHPDDEVALFDANVQGTYTLLRAAAQAKVGRFVFASSGEVYPELNPAYLPINEDHPTRPASVYGLTKLLGEEMVQNFARRAGLPYCILRFSHTQSADELFDPNSFFSGPRFYVNAKLRQLKRLPASPPVEKSIAALEAIATVEEQHYIGCNPEGVPYRMTMCDVRDMASGILLGLTHPAAQNDIFNIGPAASFNFDEAVPYLAQFTGLNVVKVNLYTAAYRYDTSTRKAQTVLGYQPQYLITRMIEDAASRLAHAHR